MTIISQEKIHIKSDKYYTNPNVDFIKIFVSLIKNSLLKGKFR